MRILLFSTLLATTGFVVGCSTTSVKLGQLNSSKGLRAPASDNQLSGSLATKFIETYLADAQIPGGVNGQFTCGVPAMGDMSGGAQSYCTMSYGNSNKKLVGDAARNFVNGYAPNAIIPGTVGGQFNCFVPAMGGTSDGVRAACTITYGTPFDKKISGDAATKFVGSYLPNAPVPGAVNGEISCFVPAMGGESSGIKPTCTFNYGESWNLSLSGEAVNQFINIYLPDAQIPGAVNCQFNCFSPAMGASSNGAQPTCTLTTYN